MSKESIKAFKERYRISEERQLELYHMCMQYGSMTAELRTLLEAGQGEGETEEHRQRIQWLSRRISAIEDAAELAGDPELAVCILTNATTGKSFDVIQTEAGQLLPVSQNTFYRKRMLFFWHLSQLI